MLAKFIMNYEIPTLFTKSTFVCALELENGEPKVTQLLLDACKSMISKRYGCDTKAIVVKNIKCEGK